MRSPAPLFPLILLALGTPTWAQGYDGQFDNNDFIVFIGLFFQRC